MANRIQTFDTSTIEAVARALGESMTGTQVGRFLAATGIKDTDEAANSSTVHSADRPRCSSSTKDTTNPIKASNADS